VAVPAIDRNRHADLIDCPVVTPCGLKRTRATVIRALLSKQVPLWAPVTPEVPCQV
jgi:hypothetical protein